MTVQTTPRELFQTADESRYTWDENFPGYTADIQLIYSSTGQGSEVYMGKISINRDLSIEVTGVAEKQVQEGIYTQLQDTVTHRKRASFEQNHSQHEFSQGETDATGAVKILVKDDMDSTYKIRGKEICQVSRVMGRMAFVIDTHESLDTGFGYIASRYDAIFRNIKTNEVSSLLKFEDTYEKIGDYYLMSKQVVQEYKDGESSTTEFSYSNIKLL
jgi:Protein of unknown function (DUF3386)